MRALLASVFFLFLLVGIPASPSQAQGTPEAEIAKVRAEIERANERMAESWAKGDAKANADLYTSGAQLLLSNLEPVKGRPAIQSLMQGVFQQGLVDLDLKTVELEVFGDTAIEVGGYVMNAPDGKHLDHGKYIVIWKKEDGQWRLHRDIANSSMPQKP